MDNTIKRKYVKNIGIIAHIDAGKTTVTERILFFTHKEHKIGEVHYGTATMDWMEEERERGITITAACTTVFWKDHCLNIVDTPGHVDFTAEVERSLRVLDGAVVVFSGVEGVEAQSETVWHQSDRYDIPKIAFINKMDRAGADFERTIKEIKETFSVIPLQLHVPIFSGTEFTGIVDLITEKAYMIPERAEDDNIIEEDIPGSLKEVCSKKREELFERLAENDESFLEQYVEGEGISIQLIRKIIKELTVKNIAVPVLCGAALKNRGVRFLLDAVIAYLPSVSELNTVTGFDLKTKQEKIRKCDIQAPFSALAFKVQHDAHGGITYLRIYSGTLTAKGRIYNSVRDRIEKASMIYRMHASTRENISEAIAGDIVAVSGLKFTVTGDTLCTKDEPIAYEVLHFPETVISMSIEPSTAADEEKMNQVLELITKDDPTFKYRMDTETGQMLISGMGELHLEVIKHKMLRDYNLKIKVGDPRVSYRETVKNTGEGEAEIKTQIGDTERYAFVALRVGPGEKHSYFEFINETNILGFPGEFVSAVRESVENSLGSGVIMGYPVIDVKVVLTAAKYKQPNSDAASFRSAGAIAFRKALLDGKPVLLEPFMKVVTVVPQEYVGGIINFFNAKRGDIVKSDMKGQLRLIEAHTPLKELFGFASRFRSITQGRGQFSMEPQEYRELPERLREETGFF